MHVFSLGRFCASPKPSPRGEDAELCSPDAVEASRPIRRRRSRAASCVISCFQSSMLLHNLSSIFSLSKKASQRAPRCTHLPHRTTAITHPAANAHQAAPVSADHRRSLHAPGRKPAPDRNGRICRKTGFPQSLHRLFHIFAGFPQRLSFPLAFFERDRVRSSEQCVLTAQ